MYNWCLSENFLKVTIPLHGLIVLSGIYFFVTGDWWRLWPALGFWTLFSGLGIAIGYHRLLSHRAFQTSSLCRRFLASLGVMAGQGSPVFWVAVHRGLHHPFSDQIRDPHSPKHGVFHSFIGWQMFFGKEDFSARCALDVLRDPYLKFISLYYYRIFWTVLILIAIIDWKMFLASLVPSIFLASHQENVVNVLCHLDGVGYRNFATSDSSNNIWLLGVLCWGQALHNNHHQYPDRWNYSVNWWEVDPCSWIIPLLEKKDLVSTPGEHK